METPISESDFYDTYPSIEHHTGDIWSDLPTFGALPDDFVSGVVVTPACDLANWKVDTLTYLPIVSLRSYFTTRLSLQKIKDEVGSQLDALGFSAILDIPPGYIPPRIDEVRAAQSLLRQETTKTGAGRKQCEGIERVLKGLAVLENIAANTPNPEDFTYVRDLFAKQFRDWHARILRNAISDLHFLPADRQRPAWSAVAMHSVALFRYPLSLPLAVLEMSQHHHATAWDAVRQTHAKGFSCLSHMTRRPIKKAVLRHRFVVDVIARLTNMYGRLGSPDFTADTLERFMQDNLT